MRRLRIVLLCLFGLGAALALCIFLFVRHPRPQGAVAGPAAEELAHAVEKAVDKAAWERTLAVRWTFGGRHRHLWDRQRQRARVRFGATEVLLDLTSHKGRVYRNGAEVGGAAQAKALENAYAYWINDSFWLNPLAKLYDDGMVREAVELPGGERGLLVSYQSGGLTPGDSYLWIAGPDGLPRAWRMWVSIIPVGGVETSWEGWTTLATGARVATVHRIVPGVTLRLSDVAGAASLAELEPGPDPFLRLEDRR